MLHVPVSRVFVPNYVSRVKVQLVGCSGRNQSGEACPALLKMRARAPPGHNSSALDCRGRDPCQLEAAVPAWERWYYILVERHPASSDLYFRIGVQVTGEASSRGNEPLPDLSGTPPDLSGTPPWRECVRLLEC